MIKASSSVKTAQDNLVAALEPLLRLPAESHMRYKVIHDPIWGSCRYEPWEVTFLDMPLFQRLRGIKQTGFAYHTYPAAEHSRFQHTLGVMTAAGKIYDSIVSRYDNGAFSRRAEGSRNDLSWLKDRRWCTKLRLAALVHDLGHSLFSHTSERIISMLDVFPELKMELKDKTSKVPGAAEIVVYLLVTSDKWHNLSDEVFNNYPDNPEIKDFGRIDWEQIGNWVMGQERDPRYKFLADIISGPLDADKLDYISRDAYFAGIPVGHDYERFVTFVCIDYQGEYHRLILPEKGINALEQLIMARLALTSYLYHHQKVRAAESWFERLFALEYRQNRDFFGQKNIWELFRMEDAELYGRAIHNKQWADLLHRQLPVRYIEFRHRDLLNKDNESADQGYTRLQGWVNDGAWVDYEKLLNIESCFSKSMDMQPGDIIIDVLHTPSYADLENLEMPGRSTDKYSLIGDLLMYKDWIDAYKAHRACLRIFAPRGLDRNKLFEIVRCKFLEFGMELPEKCKTR